MAKRFKLDGNDIPNSNNGIDSNNDDDDVPMINSNTDSLHHKLRQFDVLDEVQGDDSDSDEIAGELLLEPHANHWRI